MSETNEKKDGSCCKSNHSGCCGGKKLFVGILIGVVLTLVLKCLVFGGGICGQQKMCPMMPQATQQAPVAQ